MHIVVFGAGGIGGYFGGCLAQAGEKVTFIARGEHLKAMLAEGLHIEGMRGNFVIRPVVATNDTSKVKDVDVILVCVKAWQIPEAAEAIKPMLGSNTFIVPLENGLDASTQLADMLGREYVLGGLCGIFSHIASPGHIQVSGRGAGVTFGELDNRPSSRVQDLLHAFERAGVEAENPPDIFYALWDKFFFVSAFSGLGAITRVPVGGFRSLEETRKMLIEAYEECYSVAKAQGIHLPEDSVTNVMASIDHFPPNIISSLQRDIMAGNPSELEAQIGVVVRMGKKLNLPTPVYDFIYYSLLPQENIARSKGV